MEKVYWKTRYHKMITKAESIKSCTVKNITYGDLSILWEHPTLSFEAAVSECSTEYWKFRKIQMATPAMETF